MVETWILILVIVSQGVNTNSFEFTSERSCEIARNKIAVDYTQSTKRMNTFSAVCVKK